MNLIIAESYSRAVEVLSSNRKGLTELAELLLEKEVIFSEDLERIFGKRKAEALKEAREALVQPVSNALPEAGESVNDNSASKKAKSSKKAEANEKSSATEKKKSKSKEPVAAPAKKRGRPSQK